MKPYIPDLDLLEQEADYQANQRYVIDINWFDNIHWRHPLYGTVGYKEFLILNDNDDVIDIIKLYENEIIASQNPYGRFYMVDKGRYDTIKSYMK